MHAGAGGRFRYDLKLTKVGRRRGWLLAGVSGAALACSLPSAVSAATYFASNDGQLRSAITTANGDGDPSSTIVVTQSFTVGSTSWPTTLKPITIDTQGFVLTPQSSSGAIALIGNSNFTLMGTYQGAGGASGGSAISVRQGTSVTNFGLLQGGSGSAGVGGYGVELGGPGAAPMLTNHGVIRGGAGTPTGQSAILVRQGGSQIVNTGTIEAGAGSPAIRANGPAVNLDIINSGTIRAGAGQNNAIQLAPGVTTGAIHLELQDGSQVFGNVIANPAAVGDSLRLSGTASNSLDLSQYQNFDSFEKVGTGTWSLTGTSSFTGPTSIAGGTLSVNGSLAGSAVTVQSGATLAGSGTVGATTLLGGSRIAPGNSIGTLTVNGAFAQGAGSSYQVEVDPGTVTSDLIKVNGTATLATGAGLSVVNYTGSPYVLGQRYTILTSTGLTGTYGFPEQVLTPFLSLRDSYDARNAYLTVVQTQTAGSIGTSPNEVEVGKSIDSLPGGDPVQSGVLNQASIDAAQRALNQLSGEIHASAKTALIEDSWLLRAAINDRLRSAFGSVGSVTLNYGYSADLAPSVRGPMPLPQTDRFAVWGQGYGSWGRTDSDGNAARLKRSTGGFLVGADAAVFDNLRFGVVAGYSRSDFDVNSRLSSGESDNYHLGLYGGGQWGALNLRAGASYTWHDIETRRAVTSAFLGSIPRASYDAATAQVFGEVGYRIELGRAAFEPFAGLAYVNLHSDGFSEAGAATALTGRGDDTGVGYSTLGLRAATSLDLQGMAVTLRGGLAWRHAFGDVDPKATLAFAGSSTFTVAGLPIARDAAMVEAGLDLAIARNATLGVSYTGQLAEDAQDHSFKGVLAVRF
jgi:outer membrane autotransporter protein